MSVDEIREHIVADGLHYLSLEGMLRAAGKEHEKICTACWTDEQPVALPIAEAAQMGLFDKNAR
jgi:amidophosphoribosyltransferase